MDWNLWCVLLCNKYSKGLLLFLSFKKKTLNHCRRQKKKFCCLWNIVDCYRILTAALWGDTVKSQEPFKNNHLPKISDKINQKLILESILCFCLKNSAPSHLELLKKTFLFIRYLFLGLSLGLFNFRVEIWFVMSSLCFCALVLCKNLCNIKNWDLCTERSKFPRLYFFCKKFLVLFCEVTNDLLGTGPRYLRDLLSLHDHDSPWKLLSTRMITKPNTFWIKC